MKYSLLFLCILSLSITNAQQQTLYPVSGVNTVTVVSSVYSYADTNSKDIVSAYWTGNGNPGSWRTFFKYDLSSIPANATITSAYISLYADGTSSYGYTGQPDYGTDNASTLYRVSASWSGSSMTWNNQPGYSTTHSATLSQSTTSMQNYLGVDVTNLVKDQIQYGNYGMMIRPNQENTYYNSLIFFAPKSGADGNLPGLSITYTIPSGIRNLSNSFNGINVYPNPAKGFINVTFGKHANESITLNLYDAIGKMVFTSAEKSTGINATIPMNLQNVSNGIYFLKVKGDKGTSFNKQVVVAK